jgi:hypothetical protein
MKLREAIEKLDKSEKNEGWASPSQLGRQLGVDCWGHYDEFEKRVKKYWIKSWLCTDTYVGLAAYYLDDELVAISTQQGRKYDEEFEWVSVELRHKLRTFLLSFEEDDNMLHVINFDAEIQEPYIPGE